jgi:predicted GNAT family acetyltransferase
MKDFPIINNSTQQQFETQTREPSYLQYRFYKGNLALMHTVVPERYQGKGIASSLANFALEFAIEKHMQIMIYCPL